MSDGSGNGAFKAAKRQSRRYIRQLWQLVKRHQPARSQPPSQPPNIPSNGVFKGTTLRLLHMIPYVLITLFAVSFFWDFNNVTLSISTFVLSFEGLVRIISVSGLIGFGTNWIAITMLFKPVQKRPLLGQGLIPAQKNRIAYRLAQAVAQDLINPAIIKQKIQESNIIEIYRQRGTDYIQSLIDNPDFRSELKQLVVGYANDMTDDPHIREALAENIMQQMEQSLKETPVERFALRTYTFLKGQKIQKIIEDAIRRIPDSMEKGLNNIDDFLDRLPAYIAENSAVIEQLVTQLLHKLINQLDVHALVEENLRRYDEQRLSAIILNATNEQLRYIQYLGGILGFIGGFVIWNPYVSVPFLLILGFLILISDIVLYNHRVKS